jgi:hypothetical protein
MTKQLKNILMGVAAFAALGLGGSAIAGAASGLDQGTGQSPGAEVREIPSRRTSRARPRTTPPSRSAARRRIGPPPRPSRRRGVDARTPWSEIRGTAPPGRSR